MASVSTAVSTEIHQTGMAAESELRCRQCTPWALPAWQRLLEILRVGMERILMRAEKRQRDHEVTWHAVARSARRACGVRQSRRSAV
jgi:hypothetical protein